LYALKAQTVSFDVDYASDPYAVNGIITWTEPNCKGIAASTIYKDSTLATCWMPREVKPCSWLSTGFRETVDSKRGTEYDLKTLFML
jgi:hypothetical protein